MRYFILILCLILSACSDTYVSFDSFPGLRQLKLQQGNIVSKRALGLITSGMTREQIKFALGSPLIQDILHDRWDYVYIKDANQTKLITHHITIVFKDDKVIEIIRSVSS